MPELEVPNSDSGIKNFQYQVLTYTHNQFSKEFVNVGLLMYSPEDNCINFKYSAGKRLSAFFPNADIKFIKKQLELIDSRVRYIALILNEFDGDKERYLGSVAKLILVDDDSPLRFSESIKGIDHDLEEAFEDLFKLMVTKYIKQ